VQRYGTRDVRFTVNRIDRNFKIPSELFDSVADNLIENALNKKTDGAAIRVEVGFSQISGGTLTVCDNGAAVARNIAARLFDAPVPSQTGLGIGLYHAAKQAERLGYRLELCDNETGKVCFALSFANVALREAVPQRSSG
jgi:C4-dicarboxylate-specific signal transduction histidine kinase